MTATSEKPAMILVTEFHFGDGLYGRFSVILWTQTRLEEEGKNVAPKGEVVDIPDKTNHT